MCQYIACAEERSSRAATSTIFDLGKSAQKHNRRAHNFSVVEYGYLINDALNGDIMGTFISAMVGDIYR